MPRNDEADAVAVFKPMWATVYQGLKTRDAECGYRVILMTAKRSTENMRYPQEPEAGDVIVLVGHESQTRFLEDCRSRFAPSEVYCIFYSSEHEIHYRANYTLPGLCEVWEYTRANVPEARVVRYIPPGFLPVASSEGENDKIVRENVAALQSWPPNKKVTGLVFRIFIFVSYYIGETQFFAIYIYTHTHPLI